MCITEERAFFDRSPRLYRMTPQATEQYGHVLRVSRICASLNGRTAAAMAGSRPPKPSAPSVPPARPAPAPLSRPRLETWTVISASQKSDLV